MRTGKISWLWPVGMAAFLIIYEILFETELAPQTSAYAYIVLCLAAAFGGLWPGLISAIFVCVFNIFVWPQTDRTLSVCVAAVTIAVIVGWLKRLEMAALKRADEMLNGNAVSMRQALEKLRDVTKNWGLYSEDARLNILFDVEDKISNVLTKVFGYRTLYRQIQEVKANSQDDE